MVKVPLRLVFALNVTVFPGLLMVMLLGVFWESPVPVDWDEVPL